MIDQRTSMQNLHDEMKDVYDVEVLDMAMCMFQRYVGELKLWKEGQKRRKRLKR